MIWSRPTRAPARSQGSAWRKPSDRAKVNLGRLRRLSRQRKKHGLCAGAGCGCVGMLHLCPAARRAVPLCIHWGPWKQVILHVLHLNCLLSVVLIYFCARREAAHMLASSLTDHRGSWQPAGRWGVWPRGRRECGNCADCPPGSAYLRLVCKQACNYPMRLLHLPRLLNSVSSIRRSLMMFGSRDRGRCKGSSNMSVSSGRHHRC
jgi:hypothetical protein